MDDDFNTPLAVAALFDLAGEANRTGSDALKRQLRALAGVIGLLQREATEFLQAKIQRDEPIHLDDVEIGRRIQERTVAKRSKDYAQADQIRSELKYYGIVLEDVGETTKWRRGSVFRMIEPDELDDYRSAILRCGYSILDFEIKEYPEKNPATGIFAIRGEIEIKRMSNAKLINFQAGHGSSWPADFEDALKTGRFE
jgi:hypothetical protein